MLIRVLFALVALAMTILLVAFWSDLEGREFRFVLGGTLALCLGMIVPWGRWTRASPPGKNLALLSKLAGWCGAAYAPAALAAGSWRVGLACVLVAAASVGLWRRWSWAAWPWYALATAPLVASLVGITAWIQSLPDAGTVESVFQTARRIVGVFFFGWVSLVLVREVTAWRRGLAGGRGAHGERPHRLGERSPPAAPLARRARGRGARVPRPWRSEDGVERG